MKSINRFSMILLSGLLFLFGCEPDLDPDDMNPNKPTVNISADEASEYLVMNGATKITGSLPIAPAGQLKIDVADTTYAVMGYPIAAPNIMVKHPMGMQVASFNVIVNGASFYYQVPAEEKPVDLPAAADSLTVLVLDLQPPDDVALPYTIEVTIQVLDFDNKVIDQFIRWITVEDPEDDSCSPIDEHPCPELSGLPGVAIDNEFCDTGFPGWRWQLSIQNDGYVYRIGVPRWSAPWLTGGCCINGTSYFSFESGSLCNPNSESYKELEVSGAYHTRHWQHLYLFDNGDFYLHHTSTLSDIDLVATDFCSEEVWYDGPVMGGTRGGTHDYTPGADYLNLTYDPEKVDGPVAGDYYHRASLVSTCNVMILALPDPEFEQGFSVTHVFLREKGIGQNPLFHVFFD